MHSPFYKAGNVFFIVASISFFSLIVRKAIHMGITYDEAYSFLHHARSSLSDIFLYRGYLPANNHLLNTLSIKLFTGLFGISECTVRIGSMIGALLYICGVYRITHNLGKKKIIRYIAPILFFANPYIYDFLVVARGYSLAMGFMMIGLSFFLPALQKKHPKKYLHLFLLFFTLMSIANLSFLNVYVAVIGVYIIYTLFSEGYSMRSSEIRKRYGIISIYSIIIGALYVVPIRAMKAQNDLLFGGTTSIFSDTYHSLIKSYLYENTSHSVEVLIIIVTVIILLLSTGYAIRFFYAKKEQYRLTTAAFLLFVIASLSIVMQHRALGTPYVIERTAIYFFILFYLLILFIIENSKKIRYPLFIGGGVMMLFHFVASIHFTYIPLWHVDMPTKEIMHDLQGRRVVLGIDRFNEPAVQFYQVKDHMNMFHSFIVGDIPQSGDMYYVYEDTYRRYLAMRGASHIHVLKNYPAAKMVLFTLN